MNTNETKMTADKLTVIREFFTDDEWNAIESALNDYADYGEGEAEVADNIHRKIYQLFYNN